MISVSWKTTKKGENMAKLTVKYLTKSGPLLGEAVEKTKNKKQFWALKGLNFDVNQGEAIGLIGKNGSGKALLLKILAGIEEPSTGFVISDAHIYLASMTNSIDAKLSGMANIEKEVKKIILDEVQQGHVIKSIVNFTEIGQWIYRPVEEYSAGMISRLVLSIALFNKPEVVLLDDVFSSLEQTFFQKVMQKIRELKDLGVSFVITATTGVTLEAICERTIWMDFGEAKKIGPTPMVMRDFRFENDWYNGLSSGEKNNFIRDKQKAQIDYDITPLYNQFKEEQFENGFTRKDERKMKKAFYNNHRIDPLVELTSDAKKSDKNKKHKATNHKVKKKRGLRVLIAIVVLGLLGVGGYQLWNQHQVRQAKIAQESSKKASQRYSVSVSRAQKQASIKKVEASKANAKSISESKKNESAKAKSSQKKALEANSSTITAQDGDTLESIANRYGVSVGDIMLLNDFEGNVSISGGQNLKVPGNGVPLDQGESESLQVQEQADLNTNDYGQTQADTTTVNG